MTVILTASVMVSPRAAETSRCGYQTARVSARPRPRRDAVSAYAKVAGHMPPYLPERHVDCHEEESEPGSTRARPDTFLLAVDVSPSVQTPPPRFAAPNLQSTWLVKARNGAVKTARAR